jgi:hypothetical protein
MAQAQLDNAGSAWHHHKLHLDITSLHKSLAAINKDITKARISAASAKARSQADPLSLTLKNKADSLESALNRLLLNSQRTSAKIAKITHKIDARHKKDLARLNTHHQKLISLLTPLSTIKPSPWTATCRLCNSDALNDPQHSYIIDHQHQTWVHYACALTVETAKLAIMAPDLVSHIHPMLQSFTDSKNY